MPWQRTLLILKPDAVARGLIGRILARFEAKGLRLSALKLARLPEALVRRHYADHREKPFFSGLVRFLVSGPVVLCVAEGRDAIAVCRSMLGATCGTAAAPGTIRGDFGLSQRFNLVHASDSPRAARREIRLFFRPREIAPVDREGLRWHYDLAAGEGE